MTRISAPMAGWHSLGARENNIPLQDRDLSKSQPCVLSQPLDENSPCRRVWKGCHGKRNQNRHRVNESKRALCRPAFGRLFFCIKRKGTPDSVMAVFRQLSETTLAVLT